MAHAGLWLKSPSVDPRVVDSSVPFGVLLSMLTLHGEGLAALRAARLHFHSPSVPLGQAAAVHGVQVGQKRTAFILQK